MITLKTLSLRTESNTDEQQSHKTIMTHVGTCFDLQSRRQAGAKEPKQKPQTKLTQRHLGCSTWQTRQTGKDKHEAQDLPHFNHFWPQHFCLACPHVKVGSLNSSKSKGKCYQPLKPPLQVRGKPGADFKCSPKMLKASFCFLRFLQIIKAHAMPHVTQPAGASVFVALIHHCYPKSRPISKGRISNTSYFIVEGLFARRMSKVLSSSPPTLWFKLIFIGGSTFNWLFQMTSAQHCTLGNEKKSTTLMSLIITSVHDILIWLRETFNQLS